MIFLLEPFSNSCALDLRLVPHSSFPDTESRKTFLPDFDVLRRQNLVEGWKVQNNEPTVEELSFAHACSSATLVLAPLSLPQQAMSTSMMHPKDRSPALRNYSKSMSLLPLGPNMFGAKFTRLLLGVTKILTKIKRQEFSRCNQQVLKSGRRCARKD